MTVSMISRLVCAAVLLSMLSSARASTPPSPAEALILAELESGKVADLKILPESQRVLSPEFLERLVTGKYPGLSIGRRGIRIRGAVFAQPVDLANAVISTDLSLSACEFRSTLSLSGARALGSVSLIRTVFSGDINFENLRVESDLRLDEAKVKGSFTMRDAVIGLDLYLPQAEFFGSTNFSSMNVRHTFNADDVSFHGRVDFSHSVLGYNFTLNDSEFLHTDETNFNSISVGHSLFIRNTTFSGPVDLASVRITSNLDGSRAVFNSSLNLNSTRVGHSVYLKGARFHGPFVLASAEIGSNLEMTDCEVSSGARVTFGNVRVGRIWFLDRCEVSGPLTADGSRVGDQLLARSANFAANISFLGLDVDHSMDLSKSTFRGKATFDRIHTSELIATNTFFYGGLGLSRARVTSKLDLTDSHLGDKAEDVTTFDGLQAGALFLTNATVMAQASFDLAKVGYDFSAVGVKFLASAPVHLRGIVVEHDVLLSNAILSGGVEFDGAQLQGALDLHGAKIGQNAKSKSSFAGMKVSNRVDLGGATFKGPVDFRLSTIALNLEGDGAHFLLGLGASEADSAYVFNSMRVGHTISFGKAHFDNSVDFSGARIEANLYLAGARFSSPETSVKFDSVVVGAGLSLQGAVFAGPTTFRQTSVGSTLDASGATFSNPASPPDFSNARVAINADFTKANLAGGISLIDGHYLDLSIKGASGLDKSRLMLARTVVGRDLALQDLVIGELVATGLNVAGSAHFTSLRVRRTLDLQHARFNTLILEPVPVPELTPTKTKPDQGALLDGLTYQRLSAGKESEWRSLLTLVSRARYNAQLFADLEALFAREGYADRANDVFVAQKTLERRQLLAEPQWMSNLGSWSWSAMLWAVARNGRWPLLAWGWACIFVVVGYFVFRRQDRMVEREPKDVGKVYSPFWYSIDVLLPVLDLESEKVWTPKPNYRFGLMYLRFQTIAGWILIPIGLASLTGVIK